MPHFIPHVLFIYTLNLITNPLKLNSHYTWDINTITLELRTHYSLSIITLMLREGSHPYFVIPPKLSWLSEPFHTCTKKKCKMFFFSWVLPMQGNTFFSFHVHPSSYLFSARSESGLCQSGMLETLRLCPLCGEHRGTAGGSSCSTGNILCPSQQFVPCAHPTWQPLPSLAPCTIWRFH